MSDTHKLLLAALHDYQTRWPAEADTVERFRVLAEDWPASLERTTIHPGHFTASAWVATPDGAAVLLTHHKKLDKWLQMGGHADGESDLPAVAVREAYEESGAENLRPALLGDAGIAPEWRIFDLDIHDIPRFNTTPPHQHFDVRFAYCAPGQFDPVISHESHDLQWVPLAELHRYTRERSMTRMADKWSRIDRPVP